MGGGCKALLLPVLALAFLLSWQGFSVAASRANSKKPLPSSTAVFPIQGNVYPDGLYYVTLLIGDPPNPYFLDVDTGSDITWLQCNAPCVSCSPGLPHPLYKPKKQNIVPCNDPVCKNLPSGHSSCHDQCDYEIEYADHFSSLGVLVRDDFSVPISNSSFVRSNLAFGCGYDQRGSDVSPGASTDGMLGLGSGKSTIVSQLSSLGLIRNMIGHCFSSTSGGGGYLFFGDGLIPPRVTWTPMFHNDQNKNYAPGPANLLIGNLPSRKGLRVVFDSGSSYTYFTSQAYQLVVSSVTKDLSGKFKESPNDDTLPLCWKGPKRIKHVQEMNKYMKTFGLRFGNRAQLDIPPEGYLIISSKGNVCLGILNGTEVGLDDINLIGDVSMQSTMIIYDNENRRIGWTPADCDRLPNVEDEQAFVDGLSQPYPSSMGLFVEDGWFLNR